MRSLLLLLRLPRSPGLMEASSLLVPFTAAVTHVGWNITRAGMGRGKAMLALLRRALTKVRASGAWLAASMVRAVADLMG